MKRNEKGNLEINSADHRDCTHCTLHITRSYELHVVHVEIKLFTLKNYLNYGYQSKSYRAQRRF